MKSGLLLLISLVVMASLAGDSSAPSAKSRDVGRYRLLHAPNTLLIKGGPTIQCVFKIDSVTGETWIYKQGYVGTNFVQGWFELDSFRAAPPLDLEPVDSK